MSSLSRQAKRVEGEEIEETPRLPFVVWRNIFVVIDDGSVAIDDIEAISGRVLSLGQRYPGGVGGLTVIPATGRPPSEENRQAIKQAYGRVSGHLKAMCWMVDGQGFRAATIRAALAGLRLLLQPPFPTKVAANLNEGVPWLFSQLKNEFSSGIAEGVNEIREELKSIQRSRRSVHPFEG